MQEALIQLGAYIASQAESVTGEPVVELDELTITARTDKIVDLLVFLRNDPECRFSLLVDLCGVDFPGRSDRFEIVYHLLSMHLNQRIRVKISTDAKAPIPSVTSVHPSAEWFEREAWDMYGIMFADHPDHRRLLTDYGFEGHPLRKDFPLSGHVEVRYSEEEKRVVYEPVTLTQAFRSFDFLSPWEGAKYILPGDEKAEDAGEEAAE